MKRQIFNFLFVWMFVFNNQAHSIESEDLYLVDFLQNNVEHEQKTENSMADKLTIAIENTGWKAEGITFDAVLPQKAELVSFSVSTHEQKYLATKTNDQNGQKFLKDAKRNNKNAAIYKPKYFDEMSFENVQTSSESVHIRPHHKMTFDLEYNSHLLRGVVTEEKVLDEAFVVVHLDGDLKAEISSPNYPSDYPNFGRFAWLFKTTEGNKINFSISDMNIEKCCDELLVYDGENRSSSILALVSGKNSGENSWSFESKYSALLVVFKTDCSKTERGFHGFVNVVPGFSDNITPAPVDPVTTPGLVDPVATTDAMDPNTSCNGGIYLQGSDYIYHPNHRGNYSNNQTCSWVVQSSNGKQIYLYIAIYGLDDGDYLKVYDGDSAYGKFYVAYTNGHPSGWSGHALQSRSNAFYIEFTSDSQGTEQGFLLYYNEAKSDDAESSYPQYTTPSYPISQHQPQCYGVQLQTDGILFSPDFPNIYQGSNNCTWTIQTDFGKTIRLTFFVYGISDRDLLSVYDGESTSNRLIDTFTDFHSYTGYSYHSSSNNILITFTSDGTETDKGFSIQYYQQD